MRMLRFVPFLLCAACIHAQTPVDKAWSILSGAAQGKNDGDREKAIHALGLLTGNERARTLAENALSDDTEDVRATAADVLGIMGAKESVPKLKAALKDKETSVVFAAANALFVLGDPAAFDVYYAVLTGKMKSGDSLVESQLKMLKDPKALGHMGLEAGIGFIPFGGVSLSVVKMLTSDTVSPVRATAAAKLIGDPDPKSHQALLDTAKDEKWIVRAAVVGALAHQKDPAALSVIAPLLDDDNDVVRFNAAAAIIQLSSLAPVSPANE